MRFADDHRYISHNRQSVQNPRHPLFSANIEIKLDSVYVRVEDSGFPDWLMISLVPYKSLVVYEHPQRVTGSDESVHANVELVSVHQVGPG